MTNRMILGAVLAAMAATHLHAQVGEGYRPLDMRPMPEAQAARAKAVGNTHFIYEHLPQSLPIVDDFSVDRTRKRNASPDDPGVTLDETIYRLEVDGVSTPDMSFSTSPTFRFIIDTTDPDSVVLDQEELPSVEVVVRNVTVYPPETMVVTAWPPYNIIDSVATPPADTIHLPSPQLLQDSMLVYRVEPGSATYDQQGISQPWILWEDDDVYVNNNFPLDPPTIGVATFDGLSRTGMPYNFSNFNAYGVADHLTSVPINMGGYSAADSIYLSFFFQPQGLSGDDQSQPQDSLVLEFYSPIEDSWTRVWGVPHFPLAGFQQVMIPIKEFKYLQNGFRIRFKNYATLSGAFDHWHLDYLRLAANRTYDDREITDVAWMMPAHTLLHTYTSVPFKKFALAPHSYMAPDVTAPQRNLADQDRFISWRMDVGLVDGPTTLDIPFGAYTNTSGNANSIFSASLPVNTPPYNFAYDPDLSEHVAWWRVRMITNANPDANAYNDTLTFVQELSNYYSYDDGSAEAGYYLNAAGAQLAVRFDMQGGDSLRAVRMYFAPIANQSPDPHPSQGSFLVTVWKQIEPEPIILHQNYSFSSPEYRQDGPNKFVEYPLDSAIWVEGTFYIGWTQTNAVKMNLGLDRNRDNSARTFFRVGSSWTQSSIAGSLMMRPVFVSPEDPFIGIPELHTPQALRAYPNPASDGFFLMGIDPWTGMERVRCIDATGRTVLESTVPAMGWVTTAGLAQGVYQVVVTDRSGAPMGHTRVVIGH